MENTKKSLLMEVYKKGQRYQQQIEYARHIFLAMADALAQETVTVATDKQEIRPVMSSRQFAEQLCRIFECQRISFLLVETETEVLHPLVTVDSTPEQEQQWHARLAEARLSTLLNNLFTMPHLLDIVLLEKTNPLFCEHYAYRLMAPICAQTQLVGFLMMGYDDLDYTPFPYECELIKTLTSLGELVIEQEKILAERDIAVAELQSTAELLEHINTVKNTFLTIVSREFRTTLTSIQGFSEMMRDEEFSIMEMKEFATDIHADVKHLMHLLNDMLDEDRMEARYGKLHLEWLDLNTLIREVLERFQPLLIQHDVHLQLSSVLPILIGDRHKLTQVLATVLHNALTYSPEDGEITVTSTTEGNLIHISVRNEGMGIGPADIDRIFEYYPRITPLPVPAVEGTGIGLPRVRQMLAIHGGQIWAESVPGEWSQFHITVPFVGGPLNERA